MNSSQSSSIRQSQQERKKKLAQRKYNSNTQHYSDYDVEGSKFYRHVFDPEIGDWVKETRHPEYEIEGSKFFGHVLDLTTGEWLIPEKEPLDPYPRSSRIRIKGFRKPPYRCHVWYKGRWLSLKGCQHNMDHPHAPPLPKPSKDLDNEEDESEDQKSIM